MIILIIEWIIISRIGPEYVEFAEYESSLHSSSTSQNQKYVGKEIETRGYLVSTVTVNDFSDYLNRLSPDIGSGGGTGYLNIVNATNDIDDPNGLLFHTEEDTRHLMNSAVTMHCKASSIDGEIAVLNAGDCIVEYYGSKI